MSEPRTCGECRHLGEVLGGFGECAHFLAQGNKHGWLFMPDEPACGQFAPRPEADGLVSHG